MRTDYYDPMADPRLVQSALDAGVPLGELDGWFSKIFKKVGGLVNKVAPFAPIAALIPGVGPLIGAGIGIAGRLVGAALEPGQEQQGQPRIGPPAIPMPPKPAAPPKKPGITNTQLLIGGAALLLFLGSKK